MAECQKMEEQKVAELVFEAPKPENTNENERTIKVDNNLWMKEGEIFTVRSLANALGIDKTSAWKKIKKLVNKGKLKKVGKKKLGTNRKATAYMAINDDKNKTEAKLEKAKKQKADKAKPKNEKNKPAPVDEKPKNRQDEAWKQYDEVVKQLREEQAKKVDEPEKDEGYDLLLTGTLANKAGEIKASAELSVQVDADVLHTTFMKNLLWRMFDKY